MIQPPSGGSVSYSGLTDGAIYSSGNVNSLSGTVADNQVSGGQIGWRSAYTLATDVVGGKNITITNNLIYATRPDKTKPPSDNSNLKAGTLGLVANNIPISASAPANLEIDAVMLAGGRNTSTGSFYATNYDSRTPVGTLKVVGGIIQKKRGPVGTFNSGNGQMQTGYSKNYKYDPRLADNPPPFFPTTGCFDRVSWRRIPM